MTDTGRKLQVQISIMGSDGEWFQPHQVPAALAAFEAIGLDIQEMPGSYTDDNLRQFREALKILDGVISRRIGPA